MGELKIESKKYGEHIVLFDDEDSNLIESFKWRPFTNPSSRTIYAMGSRSIGRDKINVFMHRLVLSLIDPKIHTDHRNGNGLDNRKANLRQATASQNIANGRLPKSSTTGYKGVCKVGESVYKAHISYKYKSIHIGLYPTAELAANAYNNAAKLYFGEFARLNTLNNSLHCNPNTNIHFRVINSCDAVDSGNYGYCKSCNSAVY